MRKNILIALFSLLMILLLNGCQPKVQISSKTTTNTLEEQVHPHQPKPEWTATFTRAAYLIGKKKQDVVDSFGPPKFVDDSGDFGNPGSLSYTYELPFFKLIIWFNDIKVNRSGAILTPTYTAVNQKDEENRKVTSLQFFINKEVEINAKQVWDNCEGKGKKPHTTLYNDTILKRFWENNNNFTQTENNISQIRFPIRMRGEIIKSTNIVLQGGNPHAPFKQGAESFDVKSNKYVNGPTTVDHDFDWGQTRLQFIYAGIENHLMYYDFPYDMQIQTP